MTISPLRGIASMLDAAANVFRAADSVSFDLAQATNLAKKGDELVDAARSALYKLMEGGVTTPRGDRLLNLPKLEG